MIFPPLLRDSSGNIIPQIWDGANWQPYKGQVEGLEALTLLIEGLGTLTELFGESLSDRPPANSVSVGTTFMVVGDTVVYQSNGKDWVVISE